MRRSSLAIGFLDIFVATVVVFGAASSASAAGPTGIKICETNAASKTCAAAAATLRAQNDPEGEDETRYPDVDCASALPVYINLYICGNAVNCTKFGVDEYSDLLKMSDTSISAGVEAAAAKDFGPAVPKEWIEGRKASNIATIKAAQKLLAELKVKQVSNVKGRRMCLASAKFDADAVKPIALGWAITVVRRRKPRPETWAETIAQAEPVAEMFARCLAADNAFTVQNAVISMPEYVFVKGCK